jgi:NADH-quinone oxidoreductase subunit L
MNLLWLVPFFPYLGFFLLAVCGRLLSRRQMTLVGVGSVGASALVTFILAAQFAVSPPAGGAYSQILWTWIQTGGFSIEIGLHLDALSLLMICVITFVSFLIHIYSSEFMDADSDYRRFFAAMNLFVGSMIVLVLAGNLLLLYLGWEGVGLCSYLLIGFWYKDPANARAALKAFIVTRVGDVAFAVALFILYTQTGTLDIQKISVEASHFWHYGSTAITTVALLLLGGAVGKSAQLPLQTWLPDAMAGPTPVSALIHSSTMVTAGVYLIARTNALFALAPAAQSTVAIVGVLTLLLAGFSALAQKDIKRVLAYSTMSQIGYMFLALGVGAYSAAMFHFMTHAFFKALLFLGAGVIIHQLHDEHDMFKMGGLRKLMPVTFWTFLIASASLAALPLVTAGFYSKDLIIWDAYSSSSGSLWLWGGALLGAFITALYTFRMVFITFFGNPKIIPEKNVGPRMTVPLLVLAGLSIIGGFVETPDSLGGIKLFSNFLTSIVPPVPLRFAGKGPEELFQFISACVACIGIVFAYTFYLRRPDAAKSLSETAAGSFLRRFWFDGWAFDRLYNFLFIAPYVRLARLSKDDAIDRGPAGIARTADRLHEMFSKSENGRVRSYATGIVAGAVVILGLVLLL